jgi:hypothetical protein
MPRKIEMRKHQRKSAQVMRTDSRLCKLATGEWAIVAPGRQPVRIIEGEIFELEIGRKIRRGTMARDGTLAEGYELREGMRARFYDGREQFAKLTKDPMP